MLEDGLLALDQPAFLDIVETCLVIQTRLNKGENMKPSAFKATPKLSPDAGHALESIGSVTRYHRYDYLC
jgi:hypothetical protein